VAGGGSPRSTRKLRALALATRSFASVAGALGLVGALGSAASADSPVVVVVSNATYGDILATPSGLALYTLDTDHGGRSTCTGSCIKAWPPLTVPAGTTPTGGPGVTGTLASSKQADGSYQVTYDGALLYTFVSDSPGTVTGDGVAGFFVVNVQPAATTTTTSPVSSGGPTQNPSGTSIPATSSAGTSSAGSPASGGGSSTPSLNSSAGSGSAAPFTAATGTGTGTLARSAASLAATGSGTSTWIVAVVGAAFLFLGTAARLSARRPFATFVRRPQEDQRDDA
jgi:predicted lipoprotein with Yx(FWY)xxD motif